MDRKEEYNINKNDSNNKHIKSLFEWMDSIITAIVVVILFLTFVFRMVTVSGESMMNTLFDGDKLIISNLFYKPTNGDVVVISHGKELYEPLVKRVIAVGGQKVDINFETGDVMIDGNLIDEPYIKEKTSRKGDVEFPLTVPQEQYLVLGDNRNNSLDSKYSIVGLIDRDDIFGKARLIIYPFDRFGIIH